MKNEEMPAGIIFIFHLAFFIAYFTLTVHDTGTFSGG